MIVTYLCCEVLETWSEISEYARGTVVPYPHIYDVSVSCLYLRKGSYQ
jgi:hypothetical protein